MIENMDAKTQGKHLEHDQDEKLLELFQKEQLILQKIKEKGFSAYVKSIENLKEAFGEKIKSVCCIDEGTPKGCFNRAGSGVLEEDREELLKYYRKAGVTEITSHDGCGAAAIYASTHGLDPAASDECGKKFAKELAEELGVSYRHISFEEMNRPADRHVARVAYYDTSNKFNYSKLKEQLPAGFIISGNIQSFESALFEMELAFKIATGLHGFGGLIALENPFIFSIIANTNEELEQLKKEFENVAKKFEGKVIVDGFIAPSLD